MTKPYFVFSETPIEPDPESSEECQMSQWLEWSPCEGPCEDGTVSGYKRRDRYHLVDGEPVEKYDPEVSNPCSLLFLKYLIHFPIKNMPSISSSRYPNGYPILWTFQLTRLLLLFKHLDIFGQ